MPIVLLRIVAPLVLLALLLVSPSAALAEDVGDGIRAFKEAQKSGDWRVRVEAYDALSFYDGPQIVEVMLDAMEADPHPAAKLGAAERLGRLVSDEAKADLYAAIQKGSDERRYLALLAVRSQPGPDGKDVLIELARGKEAPIAAQAAIALGQKHVPEAIPVLVELIEKAEDDQVKRAAAEALRRMAGPPPQPKIGHDGKPLPEPNPPPWVPTWYTLDTVVPALVRVLGNPKGGIERAEAWRTLVRLLKHDMGLDPAAWTALAAGKTPEEIKKKPLPYRSIFGIPLFGERMVVILDTSAQTDDPHPYDRDRLTALCEVPGARPIPWFQLQTKRDFARAWTRRWVQDLPKGAKFDVFLVNTSLNDVFGKLNSVNAGTKKAALEAIDETKAVTGQDVLGALMAAIHLGGEKDKQVWTKGPSEILYVSSSKPWLAEVTDEDHIGAAVALRAGWLQVPVHTVGVGNHPFAMMQVMSAAAGGTYLDLSK
ncbi:MAG: HEAT repeat domain-containing protein [Planctomycetota bacterium]